MTDADQKLVREVVEKVMECLVTYKGYGHDTIFTYRGQKWRLNEHPADPRYSPLLFNPITDANHRDMVEQAMFEKGWSFGCERLSMENEYIARFFKYTKPGWIWIWKQGMDPNKGRAVLLAAKAVLEAVGEGK